MNNDEIDRLIAEKVMGWEEQLACFLCKGSEPKGIFDICGACLGKGVFTEEELTPDGLLPIGHHLHRNISLFNGRTFHPTTNEKDLWQAVDKMVEDGLYYNITNEHRRGIATHWAHFFNKGLDEDKIYGEAFDEDRRMAIALAMLKAKGVEIE